MSQKKAKVKNLRNVLSTPFNIQWSDSNPEGVALLQEALEKLLPLAKLEKKSLKLDSKGKTNEKIPPGSPENHSNTFRTYLAPGFQSVIRGLEENVLCCVLLAKDITPPMIPRVICSYCKTYGIPLMIVPELKTSTKSTLGFPTMVLGFKKSVESTENPFFPIYEIVLQNRSLLENPLTEKQNSDVTSEEKNDSLVKYEKPCVLSTKSKDFYLYRDNISERVFRPGMEINGKANSQVQPKHGLDGDFISFSKSESSSVRFVNKNILKTGGKSENENDSDCDSLDEDNMFFIDDKPDHMLLDIDPSSEKEEDSVENPDIQRTHTKLLQTQEAEDLTKNKAKKMSERYFLSKVNQDGKSIKIKNKEKKIFKQKTKTLNKTDRKEELPSSTFNPMTIKTIISNPKKIRRKKKH